MSCNSMGRGLIHFKALPLGELKMSTFRRSYTHTDLIHWGTEAVYMQTFVHRGSEAVHTQTLFIEELKLCTCRPLFTEELKHTDLIHWETEAVYMQTIVHWGTEAVYIHGAHKKKLCRHNNTLCKTGVYHNYIIIISLPPSSNYQYNNNSSWHTLLYIKRMTTFNYSHKTIQLMLH